MKISNITFFVFALFLYLTPGLSQQYQWRIGLSSGYTNYYGPVSTYPSETSATIRKAFLPSISLRPESNWNASVEKRLSPSLGIALHGGRQALAGNRQGFSEIHPNGLPAASYQAEIWSIGSSLIFRMDNGKLLRETSLLAPYGQLGVGWHSWEGQSHLRLSDSPWPNFVGNEARQRFTQDQSGGEYYLDMGLGLRVRLNQQLELFVQSNAQTNGASLFEEPSRLPESNGSGHQPSRSEPVADWLFQHQAGIKFSFAPKGAAFKARTVSPSGRIVRTENEPKESSIETISSQTEGMPQPATPKDGFTSSPNPKPKASSESSVASRLYEDGPAPLASTPVGDGLESRYFPGSVRTIPSATDYPGKRITPYQSVYPVYSEPQPEPGVESFQQLRQARSLPFSGYASSRPRQPFYRLGIPVFPILRSKRMASSPDSTARDKAPEPSGGISGGMTVVPANPGLRLQAGVPLRSGSDPNWWDDLSGFQPGTVPSIAQRSDVSLPSLYATIYFEINQHAVSEPSLEKLAAIAGTLRRFPDAQVVLAGYADHTGSTRYNLSLVEKRTRSVAQALEEKFGVASNRIQLLPGAQLVRSPAPAAVPADRKVEVRILFLNSGDK